MTEAPPEKKKRKQNVACDPCKLRRVKCDLLALLSGSSASEDEPAHVLVRRHPGAVCSNCRNKGLQCSTEGILNPIRPNKGGKRIEEARKRFGGDPVVDRTGNGDTEHAVAPKPDEGVSCRPSLGPGAPPFFDVRGHQLTHPSWTTSTNTLSGAAKSTGGVDITRNNPSVMEQQPLVSFGPDDEAFLSAFLAQVQPETPTHLTSFTQPAHHTPVHQPSPAYVLGSDMILSPASREPVQTEATELWRHLSAQTPQIIAARSLRPPTPQPRHPPTDYDMAAHTPHPNTLLPALGRLDIETNQFMPILPVHGTTSQQSNQGGSTTSAGSSGTPYIKKSYDPSDQMIRYSGSSTGKRHRVDSGASTPSSFDGRLDPWDRDPWHIWQAPEERERSLVAWGRKEQVQESLADRAIGIELSRHLIGVYFQAVHFSLPVLSPEAFYMEWEACGRRSDRMNPAQEALCAVIEAWAARYSDNPAVLGLPYQKAHTAPKVIMPDGQFAPGTQARAHWGKARLSVCNALLDRAGRIIDATGIMRRPSITGLQALSLYNQLMHMSDQGGRVKDQWIQNMLVHSTVIEQMKLLQLFWTSGDPILTSDDTSLDAIQIRMKQRRLFWTTAVGDACWSAATGQPPKLPLEELEAGRAWIDEVMDSLPNSTMKVLTFFMKIWHRLVMAGRAVSQKVTRHNGKMGSTTVADLCAAVQHCWGEIRSVMTELNESIPRLLSACEPGILGFSPLNGPANMRLCCPFFLLVLHESIRNHQEFRKLLYQSYVIEPESEDCAKNRRAIDLAMLDRLHGQSVDVLLYNCRSQSAMFKDILPTGIIQSASIMIRVLIASAQFLAEVPTNEQGYPIHTLGGAGWTWAEKQKQVGICTDALYQIGWAWSDVTDVLEHIHLAMERMTPPPELLAFFQSNPPATKPDIQDQRDRESRIENDGLQSALRFWPPKSIPDMIAQMTSDGTSFAALPSKSTTTTESSSGGSSSSGIGLSTRPGSTSYENPQAGDFDVALFHKIQHLSATQNGGGQEVPGFSFPASGSTVRKTEEVSVWPGIAPDVSPGTQELLGVPSSGESENVIEGGAESGFWDLMRGGREDELDFDAFLKSFGDA